MQGQGWGFLHSKRGKNSLQSKGTLSRGESRGEPPPGLPRIEMFPQRQDSRACAEPGWLKAEIRLASLGVWPHPAYSGLSCEI